LASRREAGEANPDPATASATATAAAGGTEIDADADTVPDDADCCPNQKETLDGFEDDDGCPDAIPAELAALEGRLNGVSFESGAATLSPASHTTLDRVATILNRYPSVRIIISGHTYARGDENANSALSLQRAEAVSAYLQQKGIRPYRLLTLGVGSANPVADNSSPRGRAQNRRIELKIWVREQ
jgi:outer membrane protein OmpA-like peptidoglycan-associated protein